MFKTLILVSGICAAFLFWFKPADNLISISPVDWAKEYKNELITLRHYFGAMGIAKEIIRKENLAYS